MREEEKKLFWELCRFRDSSPERLQKLLTVRANTPAVLGHLFSNRMAGVAYGVLRDSGMLQAAGREFRAALKNAWEQNLWRNESYCRCLSLLADTLRDCEDRYAMLKGAYLCGWYPEGMRTANDIDILVMDRDIAAMDECLQQAGFRQGYIGDGRFTPATREEIITSRMMRGETVPYVRRMNLPFCEYMEVDLNFSLDYKRAKGEEIAGWLANAQTVSSGGCTIRTLDRQDFLLHLCCHLYKEAATWPWVEMRRDMTLYKFCDIYALIHDWKEADFQALEQRISRREAGTACFYALSLTKALFSEEAPALEVFLKRIAPPKPDALLKTVIDPATKRVYAYPEMTAEERFFAEDRTTLLKGGRTA